MGNAKDEKHRSGPKPERLKVQGGWEDAVGRALKKVRPEGGWEKEEGKKPKKKGVD